MDMKPGQNKNDLPERTIELNRNMTEPDAKADLFGGNIYDKDLDLLAEQIKVALSPDDAKKIDRCLELYRKQEFNILIAGEISVGKSSFLNALMGRSILLTDLSETTAAITYVKSDETDPEHSDMVRINFLDPARPPEWIPIHERDRLLEVTTSLNGNNEAIKTVKSAELFLSKKILEIPPGVTIIDTPGLNGSAAHSDLTHAEMGLCHVALFLLNADKFGTLSNKKEFQKLYDYAPEVIFVISMWDLVRNASKPLIDMKREEYMPTLGKWASNGVMTDENIFVISNKEAMKVRKEYEAMSDEQKKGCNPADLLPYPDNEFFPLAGKLNQIMRDTGKKQLLHRRPIQTMITIVDARLRALRKECDAFESGDFDRKIKIEKENIAHQQDELNIAFDNLSAFADRLAGYEIAMYRKLLEKNRGIMETKVKESLNQLTDMEIASSLHSILISIEKMVQTQTKSFFLNPLTMRFDAFSAYLGELLESQTRIQPGDMFPAQNTEKLQNNLSGITKQQMEIKTALGALSSEKSSIEFQIEQKKKTRDEKENVRSKIETKDKEAKAIKGRMDAINRKITELGPRPPVKEITTYINDYYYDYAWWDFLSLFSEKVWYKKPVNTRDASAQIKWDSDKAQLDAQLQQETNEYNRTKPDTSVLPMIDFEIRQLNADIERLEVRLNNIKNEEKAKEDAMKRYSSPRELRNRIEALCFSEIDAAFQRYIDQLPQFKVKVNHALNAFREQKERNVQQYIESLSSYHQSLVEEQKRKSGRFQKMQNHIAVLESALSTLRNKLQQIN
jgi:hypothetical protein